MAEDLVLKGRLLPPPLNREAFLAAASLGHPVAKAWRLLYAPRKEDGQGDAAALSAQLDEAETLLLSALAAAKSVLIAPLAAESGAPIDAARVDRAALEALAETEGIGEMESYVLTLLGLLHLRRKSGVGKLMLATAGAVGCPAALEELASRQGSPLPLVLGAASAGHLGAMVEAGGRLLALAAVMKRDAAERDAAGNRDWKEKETRDALEPLLEGGDAEELAFGFFGMAADEGIPEAIFNLAVCLEAGTGCPASAESAFALFKAAATKGVPQAFLRIAMVHRERGTPDDLQTALDMACACLEAGGGKDGAEAEILLFIRDCYDDLGGDEGDGWQWYAAAPDNYRPIADKALRKGTEAA